MGRTAGKTIRKKLRMKQMMIERRPGSGSLSVPPGFALLPPANAELKNGKGGEKTRPKNGVVQNLGSPSRIYSAVPFGSLVKPSEQAMSR
jgi:hypothetical protein